MFVKQRNMIPNVFQQKFSKNTFGLSHGYLQSLDIKLPLSNKIFIKNLHSDADENKVREIFSLAGKVVNIYIIRNTDGTSKGYATVTYDHPVEAVQAISMFNRQSLFGNELAVRMDMKRDTITIIPSGLSGIGPGLGQNGSALQYVRSHVEIEKIKQDIRDWMNTANEMNQNQNTSNISNTNTAPNQQNDLVKLLSQIANPIATSVVTPDVQSVLQGLMQQASLLNVLNAQNPMQNVASFMGNMGNQSNNQGWETQGNQRVNAPQPQIPASSPLQQVLSTSLQNNSGFQGVINGSGPAMSMQQPHSKGHKLCFTCRRPGHTARDCREVRCNICNTVGHTAAFCLTKGESSRQGQMMGGSNNGPSNISGSRMFNDIKEDDSSANSSDMVVFKNLPASVSIESLKSKMQEVGDVKFAEMTARGRAILRFYRPRDADKCISLFDRSRVDGQVIEVKSI